MIEIGEKCPGCGAVFRAVSGSIHRYMESSPGCWAVYGEVLAREYSDPRYFQIHRLSVDSYAVQHPGRPSRQSIQSVGLHLIRLYMFIEQGLAAEAANDAMLTAGTIKHTFKWLEPPPSLGDVTVLDVYNAGTLDKHIETVKRWANSVWQVWTPHHPTIKEWTAIAIRKN